MRNTKQYRVAVDMYVWSDDEESALEQVISELDYVCELDNNLAGFMLPRTAEAVDDKE